MSGTGHTGIEPGATIASLRHLVHLAPPIVESTAGLAAMARAVAADPTAAMAFVVDTDARLLGVVRRRDLDMHLLALAWPRVAARRVAASEQRDLLAWARGGDVRAQDLMTRVSAVRADDLVIPAVEHALDDGVDAIIVVEKGGRLLGYISVLELLVSGLAPR